ncbi:MAG: complex subunit family protein [Geminicoccaceae bacterium]|jgi:NADH dehydrogenase|nr:complex subunit family protein [Geminicoccaceae bacterium]
MRSRLVTVFGGTGFIGRHLVRRLAARELRIRVVSRNWRVHGRVLQPMGDVGQIVGGPADLASEAALAQLLAGSDAVVNLIGILYESRRQTFAEVHGELPGRIARAAVAAGVTRMVQISAIGADLSARSAYARSKAQGEQAVPAALRAATILRPSIVVGPEDGLFNRFAAMARLLPALPLIGGGRTRFQPVWVGDVADAIVAALEREDARGETFELGGPKVYSFAELMRYMLKVVGRRRLLLPLSFEVATLQARVMELLPAPPLTRDQVELLKTDNVVGAHARTLADLGITPTPIELVVPDYLVRYRARPGALAEP